MLTFNYIRFNYLVDKKICMKPLTFPLLFFILISFSSCEDSFLNPIYYFECEIDGEMFRAETNNDAWLSYFSDEDGAYSIIGERVDIDRSMTLNLFGSLGETKILVGTNVNNYIANIVLFDKDKSYNGTEPGGSGFVDVTVLTSENSEGTFEAVLVNSVDNSDVRKITHGKYKVKTR